MESESPRNPFDMLTDFLMTSPDPQAILDYTFPAEVDFRVVKLIMRNRSGELTEDETSELNDLSRADHTLKLLKLKARRILGDKRLYKLNSLLEYDIHVGVNRDGIRTIVGAYDKELIAVYFTEYGAFDGLQTRPFKQHKEIKDWVTEIGLKVQPIKIRKFFHDKYDIGIEDYPAERDIQKNPSQFSEDKLQKILEDGESWIFRADYVFWFNAGIWMNVYGNVERTLPQYLVSSETWKPTLPTISWPF